MTLIGWALDQTNVKVVCANEQTNGKEKKKEQTNDQFMSEWTFVNGWAKL